MKLKEAIQTPEYKKLSELVRGTPEALDAWNDDEIEKADDLFKKTGKIQTLVKFQRAQAELIKQIQEAQKFYNTKTMKLRDKKSYDGIDFPDTYESYRNKIFDLQKQLAEVQKAMKALQPTRNISTAKQRAIPIPVPKQKEVPAPKPKKANWWKRAFVTAVLVMGGWFGYNKTTAPKTAEPTDKGKQPQSQVVSNTYYYDNSESMSGGIQRRFKEGMNGQRNVQEDYVNAVYAAETAQQGAKGVAAVRRATNDERRMDSSDIAEIARETARYGRQATEETADWVRAIRDIGRAIRGK